MNIVAKTGGLIEVFDLHMMALCERRN